MNGSPEKLVLHVRKCTFPLLETRMIFIKSMDDNTLRISKCSSTKRERDRERKQAKKIKNTWMSIKPAQSSTIFWLVWSPFCHSIPPSPPVHKIFYCRKKGRVNISQHNCWKVFIANHWKSLLVAYEERQIWLIITFSFHLRYFCHAIY